MYNRLYTAHEDTLQSVDEGTGDLLQTHSTSQPSSLSLSVLDVFDAVDKTIAL